MNKAFEGDTFIKAELIKLRDKFGLTSCIESGTQYGSTTLELYDIFKRVVTIEIDEDLLFKAKKRFEGLNITAVDGRSEYWLNNFREEPCLYYLDAHGNGECPLKEELDIISSKNDSNRQCIAIHDCKNEENDIFGYDTYDGQPITYEWIKPMLEKIYGKNGYTHYYNTGVDENSAKRGIIYITPKQ